MGSSSKVDCGVYDHWDVVFCFHSLQQETTIQPGPSTHAKPSIEAEMFGLVERYFLPPTCCVFSDTETDLAVNVISHSYKSKKERCICPLTYYTFLTVFQFYYEPSLVFILLCHLARQVTYLSACAIAPSNDHIPPTAHWEHVGPEGSWVSFPA